MLCSHANNAADTLVKDLSMDTSIDPSTYFHIILHPSPKEKECIRRKSVEQKRMNKSNFSSMILGFAGGSVAGNQFCKQNHARLLKNEKLQVNLPQTKDEIMERVPKAISAAAKELVPHQTVEINPNTEKRTT
jgi:hypothetical protein